MNTNSEESKLSRKEREFRARRNEILEAATKLFAEKGYHGTAMSEIAREAEFSTGSLYNFFKNKEELYFTLLREKIEALESGVYDVLDEEGTVEERLRLWLDKVMTFFEEERYFFRIFVEQRKEFETSAKGEWADVIFEKQETFILKMISLMQQGIDEGIFKDISPVELAMIFSGIMNSVLAYVANTEENHDVHAKGELILDVFFNGTRKLNGED